MSKSSSGIQGNGHSYKPSISSDGRFVAFESKADNLIPSDTNSTCDIFVHDRITGVTEVVSVNSQGIQGNNISSSPSISGDGKLVAFISYGANLVPGDGNQQPDVFVHDCQSGTTIRASVNSQGQEGRKLGANVDISQNGRYVAFDAYGILAPGDTNRTLDVFIHDLQTRATELVSISSQGVIGESASTNPSVSGDGRFVAFESVSKTLVPGDTNRGKDIFVRDRQRGTTTRINISSNGNQGTPTWFGANRGVNPEISANGAYVGFVSFAGNLVPNDEPPTTDVFIHHMLSGITERVSLSSQGVPARRTVFSGSSTNISLSGDGRLVFFDTEKSGLVPGDSNRASDIFVRDRLNGLGTNSIYLKGPTSSPVSGLLTLAWVTTQSSSHYSLLCSPDASGSVFRGHQLDIGPRHVQLASGVNTTNGAGRFQLHSVPLGLSGRTLYFEVVARASNGVLYDSNLVRCTFF